MENAFQGLANYSLRAKPSPWHVGAWRTATAIHWHPVYGFLLHSRSVEELGQRQYVYKASNSYYLALYRERASPWSGKRYYRPRLRH